MYNNKCYLSRDHDHTDLFYRLLGHQFRRDRGWYRVSIVLTVLDKWAIGGLTVDTLDNRFADVPQDTLIDVLLWGGTVFPFSRPPKREKRQEDCRLRPEG